jgi:3-deoxy-manno-octulosonate cytidylyltransferase (CMP-KDO synthetase)
MKSVIIIPARYKSSRFPGKPLVDLLGKPMIIWVADLSAKAIGKENVFIATDDERIADVVNEYGYSVVLTSESCLTGTDRIADAASQIDADIYINVQGDEPLINPEDILKVRDKKIEFPDAIINAYCWISENEDPDSVNIPKVITNENDQLVYMSRKALPGYKDPSNKPKRYKKQVCIYAFTKDELLKFKNFGRKSDLESFEDIEIIRFFEFDKPILMVETTSSSLAVDIPDDVHNVEVALREITK